MEKQVNIGLVQTTCEASKESNIQKTVSYIKQLAAIVPLFKIDNTTQM